MQADRDEMQMVRDREDGSGGRAAQALERAGRTLENYKKNLAAVSPEDLAGKYRKAFLRQRQKLKDELEEYLNAFVLEGVRIPDDEEGRGVADSITQALRSGGAGKKAGQAAFQELDLGKVVRIAQEQREMVWEVYGAYLARHTCLYAAGSSWDPDDPQPPLIYNNILDKFYNAETGRWERREKPPGAAVLLFLRDTEGG